MADALFGGSADWPEQAFGVQPAIPIYNVSSPFANHDCIDVENPVLDWDGLRRGFRPACGHTRETRTLQCAAHLENWEEHVLPFLRLHGPESQELDLDFPAFSRIEAEARAQCPVGTLVLNIARTLMCAKARDVSCFLKHTMAVSKMLFDLPLTVVMGSEWPVFALLNSGDWSWPGIPPGQNYDCEGVHDGVTVDWLAFRESFSPESPGSFWMESVRYVFDMKLAHQLYAGSRECLYGVYVMNICKALWAADTESSSWRVYSPYVQWVLYESLHLIGATRWPIFALLHHFTSLRRHGFQLDFTAAELGRLRFREHGEWLQSLPRSEHHAYLGVQGNWRPRFAAAVRAFQAAVEHPDSSGLRLAYVTMVYGRFNQFIKGWAERCRRLGVRNLVMATLDEDAFDLCSTHHYSEQCVRGSISVLNKYTLLLIALQLGVDVMWIDFDAFLVRNPGVALAREAEGYDLLMGYDYESDCICNGFFYIRARPHTHLWLFEFVRWLYDHPYEHDQRALSGFLNYTEKISAGPEELPPPPRWFVLDVDNHFINWGSWEGRYERLQVIHFVDGSAFSLYGRPAWDPSIPEAKRHLADQQPERAPDAPSPMDAFYERAAIDADPEELFEKVPDLRRLLDAQRMPKPVRQHCGILPSVESAFVGYGWIVAALEEKAKAAADEL